MNAGRPPLCSVSCRISGVFGQTLGLKNSRDGSLVNSVKYSINSAFEFLHVKYVYDCVNPSFASLCMMRGRVNASERRISSGFFFFSSASAHSQNAKGLVCGL